MKLKNIWLGFSKKKRIDKIKVLYDNNIINDKYKIILENNTTLPLEIAEQMTENTIGTFALPFSIVPNIMVNNINYTVPMVTEEPSVVAACSYAGKLITKSGGFTTEILDRKMIGEVALFDIDDFEKAEKVILQNKDRILNLANDSHPSIVTRGGGAVDVTTKI